MTAIIMTVVVIDGQPYHCRKRRSALWHAKTVFCVGREQKQEIQKKTWQKKKVTPLQNILNDVIIWFCKYLYILSRTRKCGCWYCKTNQNFTNFSKLKTSEMFTKLDEILQNFTKLDETLQNFTNFTKLCKTSQNCTERYRPSQNFNRLHTALLNFTKLH